MVIYGSIFRNSEKEDAHDEYLLAVAETKEDAIKNLETEMGSMYSKYTYELSDYDLLPAYTNKDFLFVGSIKDWTEPGVYSISEEEFLLTCTVAENAQNLDIPEYPVCYGAVFNESGKEGADVHAIAFAKNEAEAREALFDYMGEHFDEFEYNVFDKDLYPLFLSDAYSETYGVFELPEEGVFEMDEDEFYFVESLEIVEEKYVFLEEDAEDKSEDFEEEPCDNEEIEDGIDFDNDDVDMNDER